MTSAPQTLATFFGAGDAEAWRRRSAGLQSNPAFARLASAVAGYGDLMSWPAAFGEITGRIPDLLAIDPSKLLVGTWAKGKEFQRYADPEQYPPEETILVKLARHTIRSAHEPKVKIMANDVLVDTVDFELSMAITIEGAVLKIRGGKIHGVALGEATASGELSCEGHSLAKRESKPFELPGELAFADPFPIMPEGEEAEATAAI